MLGLPLLSLVALAISPSYVTHDQRLLRLRGGDRESTFAMLKPDVASDTHTVDEIKQRIAEAGLSIERERVCRLSRRRCGKFYAEHRTRPFYPALLGFMSSGPVVMLELSGESAIGAWRSLIGPTSTETARKEAPRSLRAMYGSDNTRNAAHGSDSPASAAREIRLMFQKPAWRRLEVYAAGLAAAFLLTKRE